MAISTLPIGPLAPLLLAMRITQGAAIGGEAPGDWVFVAEHAAACLARAIAVGRRPGALPLDPTGATGPRPRFVKVIFCTRTIFLRIGAWGPRPQRVQGSALAFALRPGARTLASPLAGLYDAPQPECSSAW